MNYAIIFALDGEQYALLKSNNPEPIKALAMLCDLHMHKLYPNAIVEISGDRAFNMAVGMHPERDEILARLRATELPLPRGVEVIEGDYHVIETA